MPGRPTSPCQCMYALTAANRRPSRTSIQLFGVEMDHLNRLTKSPPSNSRTMKAYWQAILEVAGLLAGEKFDVTRFMTNYRTHAKNGRLICSADGWTLSPAGREYFCQRLSTHKVSRQEVVNMIRLITAEEPAAGWERIR